MLNSKYRTKLYLDEKDNQTFSEVSEDWNYNFHPEKEIIYDGYAAYTEGNSGNRYMGRSPRSNIEDKNKDMKTYLGYGIDEGKVKDFYIDGESMLDHTCLFGSMGYGRTLLVSNILIQTAYNGQGLSYIDPKGSEIQHLIQQLPDSRIEDVILIEPDSEEQFELEEAIKTNKILLLDTSSLESESSRKLVTERFVSEVWSVISRTQSTENQHLLCIDEFDVVLGDEFDTINSIVSMGSDVGLSVLLPVNEPSQLTDNFRTALEQVQNVLTVNVASDDDRKATSEFFNVISSEDISELDKFEVTGRIYMDESNLEPVNFESYLEYQS